MLKDIVMLIMAAVILFFVDTAHAESWIEAYSTESTVVEFDEDSMRESSALHGRIYGTPVRITQKEDGITSLEYVEFCTNNENNTIKMRNLSVDHSPYEDKDKGWIVITQDMVEYKLFMRSVIERADEFLLGDY